MPNSNNYRGLSLRNKIFAGFLLICLLTLTASMLLSYFILKDNAAVQSRTEKQKKTEALMSFLDYAVSHANVTTEDLPAVLKNKIYEIADVNKNDVVIYDLHGNYLISNKDPNLFQQKHLPIGILNNVLKDHGSVDIKDYDPVLKQNIISSYMLLKNNTLQPIGVVYLPLFHNSDAYFNVFDKYTKYIILINFLIIFLGVWLSWIISKNLTSALTKFSEVITNLNFFEKSFTPIKYYKNDELNSLVKAYNNMVLTIQEQKERLSFKEKEAAWREMAKQVAHEVKNPLTPMKLTIQNFERKFDAQDPQVKEKVSKLSSTIVNQIDTIASVANAFSQFAQLPEKNNEEINLNFELNNIISLFSDNNVFTHFNAENIRMVIDRLYLSRIITNLVANALQAAQDGRELIVNVDVEKINKRIKITVEDNGVGIPEEKLHKIFEPNFTTKNSGMGLGLTMVHKMVEDYDGEISVVSQEGKGTKFTISFPNNL